MTKPLLLCILDGLGLNPDSRANAVAAARKPNLDWLMAKQPWTVVTTYGESVGLPAGQMGNSEVGHLNLGAGRVVEQWLLRISRALEGDFLAKSAEYRQLLKNVSGDKTLHLVGLYSSGGVHSSAEHLHLLLDKVHADFSGKIALHIITDGRDVAPQTAANDVATLQKRLTQYPRCSLTTICGRFYAMDRDKRWERIKKSYDVIVSGDGEQISDPVEYLNRSYAAGITDEFIEPAVMGGGTKVSSGDGVLFWNFREDRMREIVKALCVTDFEGFPREGIEPSGSAPFTGDRVLGFTEYDHSYHLPFLFPALEISNHLGETIANQGLAQLRVAETEKYAHVTYFFNGGKETAYAKEERALIPSPRDVKTYDQKPEMSAIQVCDTVLDAISSGKYQFIVVNFANCDMVGHTGSIKAATLAVETVDMCLGRIVDRLNKHGWQAIITADHGNAEQMVSYETNEPQTAHTTFPVPLILVGGPEGKALRLGGALCDIAPTILELMGLEQPKEMTGASLVVKEAQPIL